MKKSIYKKNTPSQVGTKQGENAKIRQKKYFRKKSQKKHEKNMKKTPSNILYSPSLRTRQNLKKMLHIGKSVAFRVSPL